MAQGRWEGPWGLLVDMATDFHQDAAVADVGFEEENLVPVGTKIFGVLEAVIAVILAVVLEKIFVAEILVHVEVDVVAVHLVVVPDVVEFQHALVSIDVLPETVLNEVVDLNGFVRFYCYSRWLEELHSQIASRFHAQSEE